MSDQRLVLAGDSCLILELEERVDPDVNARAISIAAALDRVRLSGIRDIVPTYRSIAVYFDPLVADVERLADELSELGRSVKARAETRPPIIVPVVYGGEGGPDLEEVARGAGCSADEVVAIHTAMTYRVYMLGFLAGFAYMGALDERLRLPRRATPRLRVPPGSVAIAGFQTGIYPVETPGGWHVIGRTNLKPFDPTRASPFLFAPGDSVRFVPASSEDTDTQGSTA